MKTISIKQLAAIKRVAQNVYPAQIKANKIRERIKDYSDALAELEKEIELSQAGVKAMTGYSVDYLINRDCSSSPAKYVPSENLEFDENTRLYTILELNTVSEEEPIIEESNNHKFEALVEGEDKDFGTNSSELPFNV